MSEKEILQLTLIRNETGVKKATLQKLSDYIKQKFVGWVFSDLTTKDKTITGALKEISSDLTVETRTVEGAYINLQVTTYGKIGWIRASSYLKQALEVGKEYQMFKLGSDIPKFMVYRRVYITNTIGFVLNFGTDGTIKVIPFGGNIPVDMGFNFSEVYICA